MWSIQIEPEMWIGGERCAAEMSQATCPQMATVAQCTKPWKSWAAPVVGIGGGDILQLTCHDPAPPGTRQPAGTRQSLGSSHLEDEPLETQRAYRKRSVRIVYCSHIVLYCVYNRPGTPWHINKWKERNWANSPQTAEPLSLPHISPYNQPREASNSPTSNPSSAEYV